MREIPLVWRDYIHGQIERTELLKKEGELCFLGHPIKEYSPESQALITMYAMCKAHDMQNDWRKHHEFMMLVKEGMA